MIWHRLNQPSDYFDLKYIERTISNAVEGTFSNDDDDDDGGGLFLWYGWPTKRI